jgi:hypothetical protein
LKRLQKIRAISSKEVNIDDVKFTVDKSNGRFSDCYNINTFREPVTFTSNAGRQLITWTALIKNYFVIGFQNLVQNKLYAAVNIGGLLLIWLFPYYYVVRAREAFL